MKRYRGTIIVHQLNNNYYMNPLTLKSDQDRISPYVINTIASRQVLRIKKNINRRLWSSIMRTVWQTVRRIKNEILGVKRLNKSKKKKEQKNPISCLQIKEVTFSSNKATSIQLVLQSSSRNIILLPSQQWICSL